MQRQQGDELVSTVQKLLKQQEEDKKRKELSEEELLELKKVCNSLFASKNGKLFAKRLIKICGIYSPEVSLNPQDLAYNKGRRDVYLVIRGLLEPEVLQSIEYQL